MNENLISDLFRNVISEGLGLDLSDPNLKDTPNRIARAYCQEFFENTGKEPEGNLLKTFPNNHHYDEIIMFDNIPFTSMCSHHFLPFSGLAWFLYIPNELLLGASKPARTIEFFTKQPLLQEHLSHLISTFLQEEVKPLGTMLVMRAVHSCMACRGVKTGLSSGMTTSQTTGYFRSTPTKMEALQLIQLSLNTR